MCICDNLLVCALCEQSKSILDPRVPFGGRGFRGGGSSEIAGSRSGVRGVPMLGEVPKGGNDGVYRVQAFLLLLYTLVVKCRDKWLSPATYKKREQMTNWSLY